MGVTCPPLQTCVSCLQICMQNQSINIPPRVTLCHVSPKNVYYQPNLLVDGKESPTCPSFIYPISLIFFIIFPLRLESCFIFSITREEELLFLCRFSFFNFLLVVFFLENLLFQCSCGGQNHAENRRRRSRCHKGVSSSLAWFFHLLLHVQ